MEGPFQIRPAANPPTGALPTDPLTAAAQLFREYADWLGIDLSFQGFEAELAGLPGAYAPPTGALLLAYAPNGQAVGCVAIRALREADTCEMKRLYTRPSARGAGVGRALAEAAIQAAVQAGYRTMRLDTLPRMQAAVALYRDLGFETTPPYYETPVPETIFMRRMLTGS